MKLLLNVGQTWPEVEHVYTVGYRNLAVGRIWYALDRQTEPGPWEWHLSMPLTLPDDSKGIARSKTDAVQALANALHRLILETPHDRLERAFQLAAAAGSQFYEGEEIELIVGEAVSPPAATDQPARSSVHSGAVAALTPRAAQPRVSVAVPTATGVPAALSKKRPVVRVQVARPAAQVAAPRPTVATTVSSRPANNSPS